jgi:hypothetical protein
MAELISAAVLPAVHIQVDPLPLQAASAGDHQRIISKTVPRMYMSLLLDERRVIEQRIDGFRVNSAGAYAWIVISQSSNHVSVGSSDLFN